MHFGDIDRTDDVVVAKHLRIFRAHTCLDVAVQCFLGNEGAARNDEFLNAFKAVQGAHMAPEIEARGEKPPVFTDFRVFKIQHLGPSGSIFSFATCVICQE